MWYNRLSEYLLKEGYVNNQVCPCIFIKKSKSGFAIIAVYVDDLNLVGTPEEFTTTANYLKKEFEMKDLVNLLARYNSAPTRRHWNGVKHIMRYLRGMTDMRLFYSRQLKPQLIEYADAGYLSDPHTARSQTGYLFTCGGTAISW
ncbi:secreted RxLR effector protein 161-like [Cornus florida]|uniref:secreted RxLR effector protein 161-like n=1 Tax=Cornus florida TaxID=4283 RepID=UPI00289F7711|nr:secreted RxLR effector protein 161-like [Cornus florida]